MNIVDKEGERSKEVNQSNVDSFFLQAKISTDRDRDREHHPHTPGKENARGKQNKPTRGAEGAHGLGKSTMSPPRRPYEISEKERAERYFSMYDENVILKRKQGEMEDKQKKLTVKNEFLHTEQRKLESEMRA